MINTIKSAQDWLVIADGEPLSISKLKSLAQDKAIMVLDGAYTYAKQTGIPIDILLGDFDSITPEALHVARLENVTIIDAPDQNQTDLGKGLIYIDTLCPRRITLCSALGQRLQHALYNLRLLKKFYQKNRPIILISETERIEYIHNEARHITGHPGDVIAVLGFPEAMVTSSGLKYEMHDYALTFEKQNSISNVLMSTTAQLHIQGDALFIHESSPHFS